jgi:hypothetical protein
LAQQDVDQRGFAVVDVGNDGNVPNIVATHVVVDRGLSSGGKPFIISPCGYMV